MELNEKLAARRRELAIEAEKVIQAERASIEETARVALIAKQAEEAAIKNEVAKRLAEIGIVEGASNEKTVGEGAIDQHTEAVADHSEKLNPLADVGRVEPISQTVSSSKVDVEVEKVLTKAAGDRMTAGENATFFMLLFLGVLGFFVKWWVGVGLIIWAVVYIGKATERHKASILAEGKAKITDSQLDIASGRQ
jgi:hypothetical protein